MNSQDIMYEVVRHILDRVQTNADLGYYAGPGTEVFRLLCIAEAAHTGQDRADVERVRGVSYARNEPRVLALQAECDRLREEVAG